LNLGEELSITSKMFYDYRIQEPIDSLIHMRLRSYLVKNINAHICASILREVRSLLDD
jgi:hypothetical protein